MFIVIIVVTSNKCVRKYTPVWWFLYIIFGLAVEHDTWGGVDLGSSFLVGNKLNNQNCANISFFLVIIIGVIVIILIIVQVNALLETLELTDSGQRKGHFALYNCLVLGHTKYSGVQRVYCNQFPAKPFYGSHRLDHVMIWPPGFDNGAFMISPDSVWYALVLLLFSATSQTDTGSKTFDCALVSTLEVYDDPDNDNYCHYYHYCHYCYYFTFNTLL